MKDLKFTILYLMLVVVPPTVLLLLHFYLFMFTRYVFTDKDALTFMITLCLAVAAPFIAMAEGGL